MPEAMRKRSRFMCVELPMPAEVATSFPGFALANATSSATLLNLPGWTTSVVGTIANAATGVSSSVLSIAGFSNGAIV